jgi:hypothetical protein
LNSATLFPFLNLYLPSELFEVSNEPSKLALIPLGGALLRMFPISRTDYGNASSGIEVSQSLNLWVSSVFSPSVYLPSKISSTLFSRIGKNSISDK